MTAKPPTADESWDALQEWARERIREALYTKKVDLPSSPGVAAKTILLTDPDYVRLLQWTAGFKSGKRNHNFPLDNDVFRIPETA